MNTQKLTQLQQELKALTERVEKALSEQPSPTIQPFEGTKRVRIVSCESELYWYANQIGHLFNVEYFTPERYRCTEGGAINPKDCIEVEPQPVWERYPDFESCMNEEKYDVSNTGCKIVTLKNFPYGYPTEALAKYARAVMILSTVAKKWNEGVDAQNGDVYFPVKNIKHGEIIIDRFISLNWNLSILPFYFHSEELCKKSIDLFPQEWQDFFNAKNG